MVILLIAVAVLITLLIQTRGVSREQDLIVGDFERKLEALTEETRSLRSEREALEDELTHLQDTVGHLEDESQEALAETVGACRQALSLATRAFNAYVDAFNDMDVARSSIADTTAKYLRGDIGFSETTERLLEARDLQEDAYRHADRGDRIVERWDRQEEHCA